MRILPLIAIFTASATAGLGETALTLRHTEGSQSIEYRYTINSTTTRLERLGHTTVPPSPWNLIDRETGALTIVRPHNQTITTIAAEAFDAPVLAHGLPPGVGPGVGVGAAPTAPGTPAPPVPEPAAPVLPGAGIPRPNPPPPVRIGPDPALLPEGVKLPEMPALPQNSAGARNVRVGPSGIPGAPGGALPGLPPGDLPPMGLANLQGRGGVPVGELVAHEESRTLHGQPCQRHTLRLDHSLELELWLAQSPDLPPFYLLTRDYPHRNGPRDLRADWPHLVRRAGKFPFLAILRETEPPEMPGLPGANAPGPPTSKPEPRAYARWEVVSIAPAAADPSLFDKPGNYFDTNHPKLQNPNKPELLK